MASDFEKLSDEEYIVHRAKSALEDDPIAAKAWMIMAKTLYPHNFAVQFEAYKIERDAGHVKEAAKNFSNLLGKFQQEPEFWKEIEAVTAALRTDSEMLDSVGQFHCEMFRHISQDMQHQILLFTADHCEDTMEHCKLLLLLLQKFPVAVPLHGPRLVDTLLSAEKHSHSSDQPVNLYRKLLVCDLLPLLAVDNMQIDLPAKLLFKLLHKSSEFFTSYLDLKHSGQECNIEIEEPWKKLFGILDLAGKHLGWESYMTSFSNNWSKEAYWQKLVAFCQTHKVLTVEDPTNTKQLLYCILIFLLNCLYEYNLSVTSSTYMIHGQPCVALVEAFVEPNFPNPNHDIKSKRRKVEIDALLPHLTIDKSVAETRNVMSNFLMAVNCWDLLHSSEILQREFAKVSQHMRLELWLSNFMIDYSLYKGAYEDALVRLQQINSPHLQLSKNVRQASILYARKNYSAAFEHVLLVVQSLSVMNRGVLSSQLITGGSQRHLHFLCLTTQISVLQFCIKLLLRCIRDSNTPKHPNNCNEMAVGNILVLLQFDWPQEEDILPQLIEHIRKRGVFTYFLFHMYIINVDILEELTYLWSEEGGGITLDIVPHLGQRRMGTRGADKGVKEEIKLAIRRQINRSNEPLEQLMIQFITQERGHILQSLV